MCILTLYSSCKKLVDIPPPTGDVSEENVFTDDGTAIAVLTGIYITMSTNSSCFSGNASISFRGGLSADEFTLHSLVTRETEVRYYQNELAEDGVVRIGSEHWSKLYNLIFKCNAAITGLDESRALTPAIKAQLTGEAKFLRSFYYFYLVNLFGEVPLITSTDYQQNSLAARAPVDKVYDLIISDLRDAESLLSDNFLDAALLKVTTERVRPTKWAASALLARAYLFKGDFVNAELKATSVINHSSLFNLPVLNNSFLKNSIEAIWQLQPTRAGFNTEDAIAFVLTSTGPGLGPDRCVYLSPQLLGSIETGDQRMVNGIWVNSVTVGGNTYRYPFKYKVNLNNTNINSNTGTANMTEYLMVLRLGEQYLIRAEARARNSNLSGAIADVDKIRQRAGLPLIATNNPGISQTDLLNAILHERQVELFSEWGHRWFDLKRTGLVNSVMSVVTPSKGGSWQNTDALYPLPLSEIIAAPNLVQNPGY